MRRKRGWHSTKHPNIQQRHDNRCVDANKSQCICRGGRSYRARQKKKDGSWGWSKATKELAEAKRMSGQRYVEPDTGGPTLAEVGDEFFELAEAGLVGKKNGEPYSPETMRGYRPDWKNLVRSKWGDREADSIEPREWQQWFVDLARECDLTGSRLQNIKAVASAIYRWAAALGVDKLKTNPLKLVELPPGKKAKKRDRVAEADEAKALLAAIPRLKDRAVFAIAFYSALRKGEISRLDWKGDIDWDRPALLVRISKSKAGVRRVPIPKPLLKILREWFLACGRPSKGPICPGAKSCRLIERATEAWEAENRRNLAKLGPSPSGEQLEHFEARVKLKRLTLHNCRHTYASWLLAAGYSLKEIQEALGHGKSTTTADYLHTLPVRSDPTGVGRLDGYLEAGGQ